MAKIAFIDLLFNWPPNGGASVDLKEILTRLAGLHELTLFVPYFTRYTPRGDIRESLPFRIKRIPFGPCSYNCVTVPRRFKEEVDRYRPDYVFIGDGSFIKPYVAKALASYNPFLRFYTYDSLCLRHYGVFFRDGRICDRLIFKSPWFCLWCAFRSCLDTRLNTNSHALIAGLVFLPRFRRVLREALVGAGRIIVYNRFLRELLIPYNKEVTVIPSGVDTGFFRAMNKKRENDKVRILMPCRDSELKGISTVIRACDYLRANRSDFTLLLTSKKDYGRDYVQSIGWYRHDRIPELYSRSDICVVPSVWREPFGIVAVEAMAMAKPVIATATGGLEDIVIDGVTGFLVKPGDTGALAEKLTLLLDNSAQRERMGAEGLKRATEEYDRDGIVRRYYMPMFI